jgi:hypothetical protein
MINKKAYHTIGSIPKTIITTFHGFLDLFKGFKQVFVDGIKFMVLQFGIGRLRGVRVDPLVAV